MKDKIIEEMAKDLHKTHAVSAICAGKDCNHCKHAELKRFEDYTCIDLDLAESLYNAGYRKIPENAVVLTEEESVKAWKNGNCNAHAIYGLAYEQARKETAEKFAERLKEKLNEWLEDNEDLNGKINFGIAQIELIGVESLDGEIISESLIDEICKEITEGKGNENG